VGLSGVAIAITVRIVARAVVSGSRGLWYLQEENTENEDEDGRYGRAHLIAKVLANPENCNEFAAWSL
jgi:hypothetical protein